MRDSDRCVTLPNRASVTVFSLLASRFVTVVTLIYLKFSFLKEVDEKREGMKNFISRI